MLAALLCILLLSGCASTPQQDIDATSTQHSDMFNEARLAYRDNDYTKTFALLSVLASQGDVNAQYALGYLYYYGFGVIRDENIAMEWIKKAAAQGHKGATIALDRVSIIKKYENDKSKGEAETGTAPAASPTLEPGTFGASDPATDTETATDLHTQMMLQAETAEPDQTVLPTTEEQQPAPIAAAPAESEPKTIASTEPAQDTAVKTDVKPAPAAPASSQTPATVSPEQEWLRKQDPDDYTIQVISSRNKQRITSYMKKHGLTNQAYRFGLQGVSDATIYIGVYGVYSSVADARQVLQSLPDEVKEVQPWIRSFRSIQEELH